MDITWIRVHTKAEANAVEPFVCIFGYGSLMDTRSAQATMPNARNFRPAVLFNYQRVFSLVSIAAIRNGNSRRDTLEMAALAIRPHAGACVKGVAFDIPGGEFEAYKEREHRYHAMQVMADELPPAAVDGAPGSKVTCWTVVEQTDDAYRAKMTGGDAEWQQRVGQYYNDGPLWGRDDIFPLRGYLADVVLAAHSCGDASWLVNLLDGCLLADGVTTVREYLTAVGQERFPSLVHLLPRPSAIAVAPVARDSHDS